MARHRSTAGRTDSAVVEAQRRASARSRAAAAEVTSSPPRPRPARSRARASARVVRGEREREALEVARGAGRARRPPRRAPCARSTSRRVRERVARSRSPRRGARWRAARAAAGAATGGGGRRARRARAPAARARGRAPRPPRRPCGRAARRPRAAASRAPAAVERHGRLGRMRGRRAGDRRDVVDQRAVGVVADRRDHRHAQHRDGAAQRLVAEREQVGERSAAARDDDHLDLLERGEVAQRLRDRGRRVAVLHRREGPHDPSRPAAAAQPREHVVARLAALAGDDADRARQQRARQPLLRLEQPLGGELLAQPLELGEQVALAGHPQRRDARTRTTARRSRRRRSSRSRRRRPRPARRRPSVEPERVPVVRHIEHGSAPRRRAARSRPWPGPCAGSTARRRAGRARSARSRRAAAGVGADGIGPGQRAARDAGGRRGVRLGCSPPALAAERSARGGAAQAGVVGDACERRHVRRAGSPRTSPATRARRAARSRARPRRARGGRRAAADQPADAVAQLEREMRRGGAHQLAHVLDGHLVLGAQAVGMLGLLICGRSWSRSGAISSRLSMRDCTVDARWRPRRRSASRDCRPRARDRECSRAGCRAGIPATGSGSTSASSTSSSGP